MHRPSPRAVYPKGPVRTSSDAGTWCRRESRYRQASDGRKPGRDQADPRSKYKNGFYNRRNGRWYGTGGAPIISKICKDLGILTVGIVTTPFSYEGKKRQLQAEEGIRIMKQYVDTLLVISNDKLRHQFGNLKMKEAFAKADNVLATAAKCITDVINSTGQINVDFADVCTVMRNGGVAILGNAATEGENRAQRAIEEALNSPLLNDSDIRGAKWILININSSEGEHEFTMDEVEIIQNYLLSQAGESTDIILGLGYENSLGPKLGITLIATGFEHRDPFKVPIPGQVLKRKKRFSCPWDRPLKRLQKNGLFFPSPKTQKKNPPWSKLQLPCRKELQPKLMENNPPAAQPSSHSIPLSLFVQEETALQSIESTGKSIVENPVEKNEKPARIEWVLSPETVTPVTSAHQEKTKTPSGASNNSPASAASGGYLARPSNIYDEEPFSERESNPEHTPVKEPVLNTAVKNPSKEDESSPDMQLVFREDIPAADEPRAHQAQIIPMANVPAEDPAMQDDAEEPKRRAADRINKLRNLSFNINAADPNNEFETVPAYIRRNLELYNTISNVENFYSNYEVKTDDNNNTEISTINTFLDGKRPD